MNLNERPSGDWAAEREFDLRADSYAQAKLWGIDKIPTVSFQCHDPEGQWIEDMHSIHADIVEQRALLRRFC